jgi:predicted Zn-dependent protease
VVTERGAATELELARQVLALAGGQGATDAEVLVMGGAEQLTRFANSQIHQNVAETNTTINLRLVIGRQVGVIGTNRRDEDALRRLAESAASIARLQPERPDFAGLPDGRPITPVAGVAAASTAAASPEERSRAAAAVIGAADDAGVLSFGSFKTVTDRIAVVNTRGVAVYEERTHAHLITVAMGADGEAGYAEAAAVDQADIDAEALGREAAAKARASRDATDLPPGDYPVVLEEYAVVDLLDMLGYVGFSALAVQEGRSFFETGKRIGSDLVSIRDDATDTAGTPASFDYEGVPKQPVALVERGECRDVVYDMQTAAKDGRPSTGHGLPAPNPWGPFPTHMFMDAGDTDRDDLIGGLKRGLLVTRFHYTNPVHPKLAIVTGMTRDGLFLVEDGQIRRPVRNLRFTQSYLEALAGVEAVGSTRRLLRGFLGSVVVPAVRIAAFTFTGATQR